MNKEHDQSIKIYLKKFMEIYLPQLSNLTMMHMWTTVQLQEQVFIHKLCEH